LECNPKNKKISINSLFIHWWTTTTTSLSFFLSRLLSLSIYPKFNIFSHSKFKVLSSSTQIKSSKPIITKIKSWKPFLHLISWKANFFFFFPSKPIRKKTWER
jgi:hypothetical protein